MQSGGKYHSHTKDVIGLVNKFRAAGAHFDLDLPTIVFTGDQSTGKTSLLEAVSAVALPRADGTCTRCPTELRLQTCQPDGKWEGSVKLRWEYDDARQEPLLAVKERQFGPLLTHPDQVCKVVERAQLAILNPRKKSKFFADFKNAWPDPMDPATQQNQYGFSRNVICIDIRGPNMPNLTLIDLPGIIRSTEKEEEKLHVNLVRNLVIDYIKKPNAIIVATVSLKQEMENTVVRALARQADPTGVRTVGVLTKPDRIEAGAHQQKIDVLTGKMYRLEHGYWVVKSRTPAQLESGISFEEARMDERNFFRNTAPWNTLPTYVKQRLGSDFLEAKLGKILSSTISTALPLMKKRAEELLRQTRAELKAMAPGLTKSPRMYLLNIIRSFMEKVVQHVSAKHGSKQLWQLVHARFQIFWNTLQRTRPVFALKRTTQRQRMQDRIRHKVAGKPSRHEKDVTATVTNSGEQEVVERTWWGGTKVVKVNDAASAVGSLAAIATSAASAGAAGVGSFAKSVSGSSSDSSSVSSNHPLAGSSNIKVKTKRREAPEASVRKRAPKEEGKKLKSGAGRLSGITPTYSFGDVTKIIEGERGRQLRGHAPYQAKAKLIKDFLIEWRKPAQQCVSNVSEALQSLTRSLIMEEFGRFDDLASKVGLIVGNLLLQLETEARSKVDMLADMEQYQPFTLNNEYFDSSKTKILYQLREKAFGAGKREAMSVKEAIEHEQDMENAVSALAKLGYIHDKETLTKMASQPISAEDRELDEVLEVVGEVLAYFKVAYKRFGDLVPMVIDNQFMLRFTELLDDKMISELKILESDDDTISMLLSEDPMVVRRRAELEAREKRLAEVCKELINFGVGLGM